MDTIFPSYPAVLALLALGGIFGVILSIAKIILHVNKDPRILEVSDSLPGANCGACGLPGCTAYAEKIVEYDMDITLCPVGGAETVDAIAKIMGIEAGDAGTPTVARIHCQGGASEAKQTFEYDGPHTCAAAHETMGGYKACSYGCLGLADCVTVCPFDAIYMGEDGLPIVDWDACTGCGKCVEACPRDIISCVPENVEVHVLCKNQEKAPIMKKGCAVGCIGCQLCVKACKENFVDNEDIESAVTVTSFCAFIDFEACINCMKCAEVCPVPVIHPIHLSKKYKKKLETENTKKEENKAEATV